MLVAEAFLEDPEKNNILVHLDGNANNNFTWNLKWMKMRDYLSKKYGSVWKKVLHNGYYYNNYYVSKDARFYSIVSNVLMTSYVHGEYVYIQIASETGTVHRIVAETFIKNDDNLPEVNHIDYDKTNNNVSNLEWITRKGNQEHAVKNSLVKRSGNKLIKVKQDKGGIEIVPDYFVYDDGRVYSRKSWAYLTPSKTEFGYLRVWLDGDQYRVHILVARAFLPDPDDENKTEVNHLDGEKTNNDISNLEWATPSENGKHSANVLHRDVFFKNQTPVNQINIKTGKIIATFDGMKEAARQTGINCGSISKVCNGKKPSAGGSFWEFA